MSEEVFPPKWFVEVVRKKVVAEYLHCSLMQVEEMTEPQLRDAYGKAIVYLSMKGAVAERRKKLAREKRQAEEALHMLDSATTGM